MHRCAGPEFLEGAADRRLHFPSGLLLSAPLTYEFKYTIQTSFTDNLHPNIPPFVVCLSKVSRPCSGRSPLFFVGQSLTLASTLISKHLHKLYYSFWQFPSCCFFLSFCSSAGITLRPHRDRPNTGADDTRSSLHSAR